MRLALAAALLILAGCQGVERSFRAPQTVEYQGFQMPHPGEQGTLKFPTDAWPTLDALLAAATPPTPLRGRFEVIQSVRDPASWSCEIEMAFVELRILDGPDAGATGWVFSIGPILLPCRPVPNEPDPNT
jgi:hypothetical protein